MTPDPAWNNVATVSFTDDALSIVYEFQNRTLKITFGETGLMVMRSGPGRAGDKPEPFRNSPMNIALCLQWLHMGDQVSLNQHAAIPGLFPMKEAPKSRLILPRGN